MTLQNPTLEIGSHGFAEDIVQSARLRTGLNLTARFRIILTPKETACATLAGRLQLRGRNACRAQARLRRAGRNRCRLSVFTLLAPACLRLVEGRHALLLFPQGRRAFLALAGSARKLLLPWTGPILMPITKRRLCCRWSATMAGRLPLCGSRLTRQH